MVTTRLYFDRRSVKQDGTSPLKIAFTKNKKTALYSLGVSILPNQWDNRLRKVVNHTRKQQLNVILNRRLSDAETFILQLTDSKTIACMSPKAIKDKFKEFIEGKADSGALSFVERFEVFIENKHTSTKALYEQTLKKIRAFCPDVALLDWEDINTSWLNGFETSLGDVSKNYRNIFLRNIRAVFNAAIDAEDTTCYPFRRFKIRPEATRKRALSVEEIRRVFECDVEPYAEIYRDMFKLIFMLIGINCVDLHRLKSITNNGRIEYNRAKTHRLYSIKVEPEALEIIEKYKGVTGLLCISDRWSDHRNFRHQINKALQLIGAEKNQGGRLPGGAPKKTDKNKKPKGLWPSLTTYWARHTWATIAAALEIPKETIAAALGHGGNSVTDIYIDFDQQKVDEANRRVLDWVLYNKK